MPAGRPKKERKVPKCPEEFVEQLAALGVPNEEIADRLGISRDTLWRDDELSDAIKKGRAQVCDKLRSVQLRTAEKHPVMQIWLGKQLLGQRDKQDMALTGKSGEPLEVVVRLVKPNDSK